MSLLINPTHPCWKKALISFNIIFLLTIISTKNVSCPCKTRYHNSRVSWTVARMLLWCYSQWLLYVYSVCLRFYRQCKYMGFLPISNCLVKAHLLTTSHTICVRSTNSEGQVTWQSLLVLL